MHIIKFLVEKWGLEHRSKVKYKKSTGKSKMDSRGCRSRRNGKILQHGEKICITRTKTVAS